MPTSITDYNYYHGLQQMELMEQARRQQQIQSGLAGLAQNTVKEEKQPNKLLLLRDI